MGHFGKVGRDGPASGVLAKSHGEQRLGLTEAVILHDLAEAYGAALFGAVAAEIFSSTKAFICSYSACMSAISFVAITFMAKLFKTKMNKSENNAKLLFFICFPLIYRT